MIHVSNVRLGFATNSSSTHSVVLIPRPRADDWKCAVGEYGWENFTLSSLDAKMHYLAVQVKESLTHGGMPEQYAAYVAQALLAPSMPVRADNYVDHQSQWALPLRWGPSGERRLDEDFLSDLAGWLSRPEVAIGGGNDNDDGLFLPADGELLDMNIPRDAPSSVARKDGDWWVLFRRDTGAKIRLSFMSEPGPQTAETPELVDVRICSWCPHECGWCYQSANLHGLFAPRRRISSILSVLADMKVFEVALGGGDVAAHPDFSQILRDAWSCGIMPSFTSHDMAWSENPRVETAVLKCCGGFAMSYDPEGPTEVDRLVEWVGRHERFEGRVSLQVVLGLVGQHHMERIIQDLQEHDVSLTLLGYKATGRGANWLCEGRRLEKVNLPPLLAQARDQGVAVSMDTLAVRQHSEDLKECGVPEVLVTRTEGTHSCYVDAVDQLVARDSWSEDVMYFAPEKKGEYVERKLRLALEENFPWDAGQETEARIDAG